MSLTTLLLAFLPAIVRPKLEPEKGQRERELEERCEGLEEELELCRAERDSARRRLEDAQAMLARMAQAQIADRLYGRIEERQAQLQQAQHLAALAYQQGLANPLQQAQYNMQQAMNAQNFVGAQNLLGGLHDFCNCVPARHDMFLRG